MPVLLGLQTLFSLYMLYDAVSRGREQYWWLVVMFPFGEVVYFFAVYWPENKHRFGSFATLFSRPPTVEELRRDFDMTPSAHNKKRLALGLHDAGSHAEAAGLLAELLQQAPDDRDCLYGYAQALIATSDPADDDEALRALRHLTSMDRMYKDGLPAFELADLLWDADERDEAIDVLRAQTKATHRMRPHVELAKRLREVDQDHEAQKVLRRGLDSFDTSPRAIRKADAKWARRGRDLLA